MSSSLEPRTEYYPKSVEYTLSSRPSDVSWTDNGNPGYKAIASHHIDVRGDHRKPNPFGFSIKQYRPLSGVFVGLSDAGSAYAQRMTVSGPGVCYETSLKIDVGDAVQKVTSNCLDKVIKKIKESDLNLATTVGEGRETISLLKSISANAVSNFAHISRAATSRDWRRRVKLAGGSVLLYNLAIKPLLQDIEALRDHVLATPEMRQVRRIDERSTVKFTEKCDESWKDDNNNFTYHEDMDYSVRCRIALNVEITDLHQFESWRAGLLVRPSLAWELTTLSFLVDYLVGIGKMIEQYEATVMYNGFTVSDVVTTITSLDKRSVSRSGRRVRNMEYSGYAMLYENYTHSIETKSLERSVGSLPPIPPPLLKLPHTSTQLLNIAGLLTNLFKLSNRG